MDAITFERNVNFSLNPIGWGQGIPQDIVRLLDFVIKDFYSILDLTIISKSPVVVCSDLIRNPPKGYPEIIKQNGITIIILNSKDCFWSQFSYQFTHELCHYVINTTFLPVNEKFGWWEETLCELASIYTLSKMSTTWLTNPPFQNWTSYANSLFAYANTIIMRPENTITKPLSVWLSENLPSLYLDRYKRTENGIVAVNLMPLFTCTPDLWKTIQFLNQIQITADMTFEMYLGEWKNKIPKSLHSIFDQLVTLLIGNANLA